MNEFIVHAEGTRGTETSKYPEEEKERSIPKVAASEIGRAQTEGEILRGYGSAKRKTEASRKVLGKPAIGGESPVCESRRKQADTRVPRDTWNLAGSRGDHPPRLNTTQ